MGKKHDTEFGGLYVNRCPGYEPGIVCGRPVVDCRPFGVCSPCREAAVSLWYKQRGRRRPELIGGRPLLAS
jgi:hypothetical protein